jgi:hypothetical protein
MEWVEGAELFGATRSIFEVEPVYLPIAVFPESPQAILRLGLPKSDPKKVDWPVGSFWGKKSHSQAPTSIVLPGMQNPRPGFVRSCENSASLRTTAAKLVFLMVMAAMLW